MRQAVEIFGAVAGLGGALLAMGTKLDLLAGPWVWWSMLGCLVVCFSCLFTLRGSGPLGAQGQQRDADPQSDRAARNQSGRPS